MYSPNVWDNVCERSLRYLGCAVCVCAGRGEERWGLSVGRRQVLTPSLFCPVLASISCRARTDRDCSNTKLQMHRSGGTDCGIERMKRKEGREAGSQGRERREKQFEVEEAMTSCFKQKKKKFPLLRKKQFIRVYPPWNSFTDFSALLLQFHPTSLVNGTLISERKMSIYVLKSNLITNFWKKLELELTWEICLNSILPTP